MSIEAMKQALDAIETYSPEYMHGLPKKHYTKALRQAIAEEEKIAKLILEDVMSICEDLGDKGMDGHYCVDAIRNKFGLGLYVKEKDHE